MNLVNRLRIIFLFFSITWISCSIFPKSKEKCKSINSIFNNYEYVIEGRHLGCSGGVVNAMVSTSSCRIQIDTIYKAPQYLVDSFELRKKMVFEKEPQDVYLYDPNKIILRYREQIGFISKKENIPDNIIELQNKWITEKKIMCFNSETFENNFPIINDIKYYKYSERLISKLKRLSKK